MSTGRDERHRRALAQSLSLAQASADAGDYRDALLWLRTVESVGGDLSEDWLAKSRAWADAARATGPHATDVTITPGTPLA